MEDGRLHFGEIEVFARPERIRAAIMKEGAPTVADFGHDVGVGRGSFGGLLQKFGVDLAFCDELLESIRQVSSGESPEIITGANVHTLTVTPGAISLENDFAIPPIVASLSLNETIDAIEEWKRCISARERL